MSSHYQSVLDPQRCLRHFGAVPQVMPTALDIWPGSLSYFIKRAPPTPSAMHATQALAGLFGLLPHWSRDTAITRVTYNARCEDVAEKATYRQVWHRAQHCIIPAECFFEPDCRNTKPVPTRVALANAEPMGIAGLWACANTSNGDVYSFTMLTVNADEHALMRRFRRSRDEKRMVVILPPERYQEWLDAPMDASQDFMRPYAAQDMRA